MDQVNLLDRLDPMVLAVLHLLLALVGRVDLILPVGLRDQTAQYFQKDLMAPAVQKHQMYQEVQIILTVPQVP